MGSQATTSVVITTEETLSAGTLSSSSLSRVVPPDWFRDSVENATAFQTHGRTPPAPAFRR